MTRSANAGEARRSSRILARLVATSATRMKNEACGAVPVLLLAQLAVHKLAQGRGLGKVTLIQALKHCAGINAHLPSFAVIVDAINDDAKGFYEHGSFYR